MMNHAGTTELNDLMSESLAGAAGGTPMSIPGGKRSGRGNTEKALEIWDTLGDWANGILESLGLKEKPVDNSIYDRRIKEEY